tara:strand:- start:254 stop:769 length:516 start_codon:yes stop_codon:yes gene_type:complete
MNAQGFEVTPQGLRDTSNIANSYVVIDAKGVSADTLYLNALKYVNENYKNPSEVIKGQTPNEYLRFDTYVPQFTKVNNSGAMIVVSMKYSTELKFKDDKVRFEISQIEIKADNGGYKVEFSGSIWKCYPIYNQKNGELRLPETKAEIENYFNSRILLLTPYLKGESKDDDW